MGGGDGMKLTTGQLYDALVKASQENLFPDCSLEDGVEGKYVVQVNNENVILRSLDGKNPIGFFIGADKKEIAIIDPVSRKKVAEDKNGNGKEEREDGDFHVDKVNAWRELASKFVADPATTASLWRRCIPPKSSDGGVAARRKDVDTMPVAALFSAMTSSVFDRFKTDAPRCPAGRQVLSGVQILVNPLNGVTVWFPDQKMIAAFFRVGEYDSVGFQMNGISTTDMFADGTLDTVTTLVGGGSAEITNPITDAKRKGLQPAYQRFVDQLRALVKNPAAIGPLHCTEPVKK